MTEKLRRAFEAASKLSPEEQDEAAAHLLADIEGEQRWDATLEATAEHLRAMADDAMREHRAGRTRKLDTDAL